MSTTYSTRTGDTFDTIARNRYGNSLGANNIRAANPGVREPIQAGTILIIPPGPFEVSNIAPRNEPQTINEVALRIDNKRFRKWHELVVTRSLDTVDTISVVAPFTPSDIAQRSALRPFSYSDMEVTIGSDKVFDGTMVSVEPRVTPESRQVMVSGYSIPGVLMDCTMPASSYPLETSDQNLETIANNIARPFGIVVVFEADPGPAFNRTTATPAQKSWQYLSILAKQRQLIMNSTINGVLRFSQSVRTGKPVMVLEEGESPLVSVVPAFTPQGYYSTITGIEPVLVGLKGQQYTRRNFHLNKLRPLTILINDVEEGAVQSAVDGAFGRMFGAMVRYSINLNTWRDPQGVLWEPNTTIKLKAPSAMIYDTYEFLIKGVVLRRTANSETAALELVLPGAYRGESPDTLPWDG